MNATGPRPVPEETRMSSPTRHPPAWTLSRPRWAAAAALLAAVAVVGGVAGLYGAVSRTPWLTAGAASAELLAPCERTASRSARRDCVKAVVARVRSRTEVSRLAAAPRWPASTAGVTWH